MKNKTKIKNSNIDLNEESIDIDYIPIVKKELKQEFGDALNITDDLIIDLVSLKETEQDMNKKIISLNSELAKLFECNHISIFHINNKIIEIENLINNFNKVYKSNIFFDEFKLLVDIRIFINESKLENNDLYEIVCKINETTDKYMVPDVLYYNYALKSDLYAMVSKQINEELKEDKIDTLAAMSDKNKKIYKLVQTALNKFMVKHNISFNDLKNQLLKEKITKISGDNDSILKSTLTAEILESVLTNYNDNFDYISNITNTTKKIVSSYFNISYKEPVKQNDTYDCIDNCQINYHESIGYAINIASLIKTSDLNYSMFLSYKYGLNSKKCFYSIDEIESILKISKQQLIEYYKDSIIFIKNYINNSLQFENQKTKK